MILVERHDSINAVCERGHTIQLEHQFRRHCIKCSVAENEDTNATYALENAKDYTGAQS